MKVTSNIKLVAIAGLIIIFELIETGQLSSQTVWLDELDLSAATQGWGVPMKNKSIDGKTLTIAGKTLERGFATHSVSSLLILLEGKATIIPNSRFGDMKMLADYVHGLGLKIGLYSSHGPWTCGGCAGSYGYEKQDAQSYANWGFDYLKYDWCSYGSVFNGIPDNDPYKVSSLSYQGGSNLTSAIKPYKIMGEYLRQQPRDIVYSLCQCGMSDVWKWGDSVGGNCWRTTNDITDTWASVKEIALAQDKSAAWAKPGNWNDPDILVVGTVGWGNPHKSKLKPDEQYLHISLWSLFSSPLLIGCDMEKLDDFTLNLLTNDEVIEINQDPLGKQATCVQTIL